MTLYGNNNNAPVGGIMSPFQGTTPGVNGGATQQLPAGMPLLVALSLGLVSRNSLVNTVNGVNVGGPAGAQGGDPCSVDELLASGNGNQANGGTAAGAIPNQIDENQQYTVGQGAPAMLANGPTPVNVDTLGLAPVPAGVPANSIGLVSQGFAG